MYRILPRHQKPQLASERSVLDFADFPAAVIVTHDGRHQLARFPTTKRGKPDAFQWIDSRDQAAASPMVIGIEQALAVAARNGWQVWAGARHEAKALLAQWAEAGFPRRQSRPTGYSSARGPSEKETPLERPGN